MNRRLVRNTRRPRIYFSTEWRVQVGKKNFTFNSYELARKYALLHYQNGTKSNWQAYCYMKRSFLGTLLGNSRAAGWKGLPVQPLGPPTASIEFLKMRY